MKNTFKIMLLLFLIQGAFVSIVANTLFLANGSPTPALKNLLVAFSITANTPAQIVKETQEKWLRTAGKERWEAEDPYAARKAELMPLFKEVGLIKDKKPIHQSYDYLLLMGALHARAKSRLEYAISLADSGTQFKNIVILGSERALDPQQEPDFLFSGNQKPKTEFQMMKWLWEHTPKSPRMHDTPMIEINTPNKINADGKIQRATTADTLNTFLAQKPTPGSCLVISNQPHIEYQAAVTRSLLPKEFHVEGVGHDISEKAPVSEILDALARWIYQEEKMWAKAHA